MLPHVSTILQPLTPCCRGWPWEWLCKAAWTMWSHAGAYVALPGSTSMLEQVIEMYWHRWVVRLMYGSVNRANLLVSRPFPNSVLTVSRFNSLKILLNGTKKTVDFWKHEPASSKKTLRSILLILVTIAMGGRPFIENPGTSLIWLHDRFQWLLDMLEIARIRVPLPYR